MNDTELLDKFFEYCCELTQKEFEGHKKLINVSYMKWKGMTLAGTEKHTGELSHRDHLKGLFKKYPTAEEYKKATTFTEYEWDE